MFEISRSEVEMNNLTIENGYFYGYLGDGGGRLGGSAIYSSRSNITLNSVTLSGGASKEHSDGSVQISVLGGVLHASYSIVALHDCVFSSN